MTRTITAALFVVCVLATANWLTQQAAWAWVRVMVFVAGGG